MTQYASAVVCRMEDKGAKLSFREIKKKNNQRNIGVYSDMDILAGVAMNEKSRLVSGVKIHRGGVNFLRGFFCPRERKRES